MKFYAKFYATFCVSLLTVTGLVGQQTPQPGTSKNSAINDLGIFDVNKSSETWRIVKPDYDISTEELVRSNYEDLGLRSASDLQLYQSDKDQLGFIHSRYQQIYEGIPLRNIIVVFHEKDGRVESISGGIVTGLDLQTSPAAAVEKAIAAANIIASESFSLQNFRVTVVDQDQPLVIVMQDEFVRFTADNFRLCYELELQSGETRGTLYIDANSLELVRWESLVQHCSATAGTLSQYINNTSTIYSNLQFNTDPNGPNFDLYDNCRNIRTGSILMSGTTPTYTNTSTNWNSVQQGAAASLHWSAMKTHDYFSVKHGRNGFDNLGGLMQQYVAPVMGGNAMFTHGAGPGSLETHCMYGYVSTSYVISLDIVGHEWTHAMNSRSAQLVYAHEAGALNEGFADIFGTMVEDYAEIIFGDWLIGEDVSSFGPIRSMSNPLTYGHPDSYLGANWISDTPKSAYCNSSDYYSDMDGNVHTNSGVLNKWFYLLSAGGTHNSITVSGLGKNTAAAIAYRALTYYLFPYAEYSDARTASVRAAGDLHGVCSANQFQTQKAWDAVQVNPTTVEHFKVYAYLDKGVCSGSALGSCEVFTTGACSFSWSSGGTSQFNNTLTTGVNTVTVTDLSSSCTSTASVMVNSPKTYPKATDLTAYGDHGRDITSDGSGNVYMVGDFGSQAMLDQLPLSTGEMQQAFTACSTAASPYAGGFLAKFDRCGNLLWRINSQWVTNLVTTPPIVSFDAIDYGTDDMIYVAGTIEFGGSISATHSMVIINGTTHYGALGHPAFYVYHPAGVSRSMFVMRIRANSGIVEWIENDYTVKNPTIKTIQRHDILDRTFIGGKSNNKGFIMEIANGTGQEVFSPNFPTFFSGNANSVVNDIEINPWVDQVYVAGTLETGTMTIFPATWGVNLITPAISDAFCFRISNNVNNLQWIKQANTQPGRWAEGNDIALNPNGDAYLVGTFKGPISNPFASWIPMISSSASNMYIARLNFNTGQAMQIRGMQDATCTWVSGLNVTRANSNLFMSGQFIGTAMTLQGGSTPVSSNNTTSPNMWIGAVDLNLNPIDLNALDAVDPVYPSGITFNQQSVFSSGFCSSDLTDNVASSLYLTNSSFNTGVELAFCSRTDIAGFNFFKQAGEEEIITNHPDVKHVKSISPNPTSDYLGIKFEEDISGEIVLLDVYGRVILTQTITKSTQHVLDVSTLADGVYMLRLNIGGQFETHRIIKAH